MIIINPRLRLILERLLSATVNYQNQKAGSLFGNESTAAGIGRFDKQISDNSLEQLWITRLDYSPCLDRLTSVCVQRPGALLMKICVDAPNENDKICISAQFGSDSILLTRDATRKPVQMQ